MGIIDQATAKLAADYYPVGTVLPIKDNTLGQMSPNMLGIKGTWELQRIGNEFCGEDWGVVGASGTNAFATTEEIVDSGGNITGNRRPTIFYFNSSTVVAAETTSGNDTPYWRIYAFESQLMLYIKFKWKTSSITNGQIIGTLNWDMLYNTGVHRGVGGTYYSTGLAYSTNSAIIRLGLQNATGGASGTGTGTGKPNLVVNGTTIFKGTSGTITTAGVIDGWIPIMGQRIAQNADGTGGPGGFNPAVIPQVCYWVRTA